MEEIVNVARVLKLLVRVRLDLVQSSSCFTARTQELMRGLDGRFKMFKPCSVGSGRFGTDSLIGSHGDS